MKLFLASFFTFILARQGFFLQCKITTLLEKYFFLIGKKACQTCSASHPPPAYTNIRTREEKLLKHRGCQHLVRAVSKRGQKPICSVPSPNRGTSNRIYYGVGTDQVLPNPGLGPYSGTGKKPLIPPFISPHEQLHPTGQNFLSHELKIAGYGDEKTSKFSPVFLPYSASFPYL